MPDNVKQTLQEEPETADWWEVSEQMDTTLDMLEELPEEITPDRFPAVIF